MATAGQAGRRSLPTSAVVLAALGVYGVLTALSLQHGQSLAEEIAALIRSAWYVRHQVAPYTATDATGGMPLYPYALGFWQQVAGLGDITGRALSIALGLIAGILLFLISLRMTANSVAAAGAAFLFLGTPATAYAFATATPAALLSTLHLAAMLLIVAHLGRPRIWASLALGLVCTLMYFTRTDAFLAVIVLVPLYLAGIGRHRLGHAGLVLATIAVLTGLLLAAFPDKLAHDAARLPILSPWIDRFVAANFALIDQGTTNAVGFSMSRLHATELLYGFILPYAGTIVLALLLPWLAGTGLRVLWIATLYFLWLAVTHYVANGARIGITDAPTFIGAGALAAGLALALVGRAARAHALPSTPATVAVAVAALGLNFFLPALAQDRGYKLYPSVRLREPMATPERDDTVALARWIASYSSTPEAILPIYGLGRVPLPAMPYAVFLADHAMPAQSLDLLGTHRSINARLPAARREAVQAAIEDESLWSDDTMRRWIDRDYDVILYQDDRSVDLSALRDMIAARFDIAASTSYRGQPIVLYKRKASQ